MGYVCSKDDTTVTKPDSSVPSAREAGVKPDSGVPSTGDTTAPRVAISEPAASAEVTSPVTVKVQATDDRGVVRVELSSDSSLLATLNAAPYDFSITLKVGTHVITATAYDAANNKGTATVTITVKSDVSIVPPSGSADGGVSSASRQLGEQCENGSTCQSNMCVQDGDAKYCSQSCTEATGCPNNGQCLQAIGSQWVCAYRASSSGQTFNGPAIGGCSHAGSASLGPLAGLLLLAGLLMLARRRHN